MISNGLERFWTTYADPKTASHHRSDSIESQVLYTRGSGKKNSEPAFTQLVNYPSQMPTYNDEQLESAFRTQQHLETKLEEYETHILQSEDSSKATTKKYHDLQK